MAYTALLMANYCRSQDTASALEIILQRMQAQ